jgi:hypothetical protein
LEGKRFWPVFLLSGKSIKVLSSRGCILTTSINRLRRVRWRVVMRILQRLCRASSLSRLNIQLLSRLVLAPLTCRVD